MTTLSKVCTRCHCDIPISEFYGRRGGGYLAWCKTCMKEHSAGQSKQPRLNAWESRVHSENVALAKLSSVGVWAQTGKSCSSPHVDIVAWGCVHIEAKYSRLTDRNGQFTFATTPAQQQVGLRADLVMLICDYGDERGCTYHLLPADDDAFYMHPDDPDRRRLKTGVTYKPGQTNRKHELNRVLLTDDLMASTQDAWWLIDEVRERIKTRLAQGQPPR